MLIKQKALQYSEVIYITTVIQNNKNLPTNVHKTHHHAYNAGNGPDRLALVCLVCNF